MDYKWFREKAVPVFKNQKLLVAWLLKTARDSDDKMISTSEFVYDFGIPRISAVIFNLREDMWEIKTIKIGKKHYHELVYTYDELKKELREERQGLRGMEINFTAVDEVNYGR